MASLDAKVQRAEVTVDLASGVRYTFVFEPTLDDDGRPEHAVTWTADIQRPAEEVTDYDVDTFRKFEMGPLAFGDVRFNGPLVEQKREMRPKVERKPAPYRCDGCGKTSRIVAHRPGCPVGEYPQAVSS
jgi:hypothetical protein